MNELEAQVRKFYSEIWDRKNFEEIPNVLHRDVEFRGSLGQEKRGHSGIKEYIIFVHSALTNYRCIIDDIVVGQEKVFAKMTFTGFHSSEFMGFPATHKQVSWAGAALFNFFGTKISSLWVIGDIKDLERQLANKT